MKLDLTKTTFIIPVSIESVDREINTRITLLYLTKYLDTNIIVLEHDIISPKMGRIIRELGLQNKVKYIYSDDDKIIFHRTKFLNQMLDLVTTPVTVNYDVDILLEPETYFESQEKILDGCDLIYPYGFGKFQKSIYGSGRDKLIREMSLDSLSDTDVLLSESKYGHCQFFNTKSYRNGGMENENFISYGPEDIERAYRFEKLGYNVSWCENYVYHIEHTRGINSSEKNPYFKENMKLYDDLILLDDKEFKNYYKNVDYIKKYKI